MCSIIAGVSMLVFTREGGRVLKTLFIYNLNKLLGMPYGYDTVIAIKNGI